MTSYKRCYNYCRITAAGRRLVHVLGLLSNIDCSPVQWNSIRLLLQPCRRLALTCGWLDDGLWITSIGKYVLCYIYIMHRPRHDAESLKTRKSSHRPTVLSGGVKRRICEENTSSAAYICYLLRAIHVRYGRNDPSCSQLVILIVSHVECEMD
jgi:hypothetical protein